MNLLMYVIKHYVVHAVYFTRVADKGQIRLLPNFTQSFISTIKAQEPILKNRSSGKYPKRGLREGPTFWGRPHICNPYKFEVFPKTCEVFPKTCEVFLKDLGVCKSLGKDIKVCIAVH